MLDNNDKKWLSERFDAMDKYARELRKETDARFSIMMEESRRQNEKFQNECLAHIDKKLNGGQTPVDL